MEPYVNLYDPVEVDLLYHQSVTDVFEGKIPLTKVDAVSLAIGLQYFYISFQSATDCSKKLLILLVISYSCIKSIILVIVLNIVMYLLSNEATG